MMFRRAYLESRSVLADSGEQVVDINVLDPITALWIEVRAGNGTTNNQANTVAQNITAIELVDGSNVLYSLNGQEALAWTAYYLGHIPDQLIDESLSNTQNASILIPFGRWLGDTEWALDPTRFKNLQLRVRWNLATITAVGVTGFTSGTGRLTVVAEVMEGAPSPGYMLMARQHWTGAGAASGVAYVDLPTDYDYAAMLIRAYVAGTAPYGVVSQVKLQADANKFIPLDFRMTDLLRMQSIYQKPFAYYHRFDLTSGDTAVTILKFQEQASMIGQDDADAVVTYQTSGVGQGVVRVYVAGTVQTSDMSFNAMVQGYAPYGVVPISFGQFGDPSQWVQATGWRSARLELTQGAASAALSVVLVQNRPYL